MLKKMIATIMIISLATVYANQYKLEAKQMRGQLTQTFNELNFKLNVEWDQKDTSFFNKTMDNFESEIIDLQSEGLTNEELVKFTMSNIKNTSEKAQVKKVAELIGTSNMSAEEARAFAVKHLNQTYSQGASWTGGRVALKKAFLLAAIIIIAIIITKKKEQPQSTPTPSETPVPTPTFTPTPSPTFTPTPSPTFTPTPSPTFTPTPSPTFAPCFGPNSLNLNCN